MCIFLETDRLVLRSFTRADADHLLALDNDPGVMRFINGGRPTSREAIQAQTLPRLLREYPCFGTRGYWATENYSD
jgi:RimJ/RimL family protein N-acetyltransferase